MAALYPTDPDEPTGLGACWAVVRAFDGLYTLGTGGRRAEFPMGEITVLIQRAGEGDAQARDAVFSMLYGDLRKLAHARIGQNSRHTLLNTTAVVHEAYLRLNQAGALNAEDKNHYLAYASHAMRSVIVDFVRARAAERRGGDVQHVTLTPQISDVSASDETQILKVHEALEELAAVDPRAVQVVEMKYFAGLSESEVAAALGVSERTVCRDWQKARYLLAAALT
jgi:RNA polymerase sigma factor (TIGR02999 family)